jgi:hypothetical protein
MWRESSECGMARKYIYSRTFSDHSRSFSIYSQTILDRSRSILEHSHHYRTRTDTPRFGYRHFSTRSQRYCICFYTSLFMLTNLCTLLFKRLWARARALSVAVLFNQTVTGSCCVAREAETSSPNHSIIRVNSIRPSFSLLTFNHSIDHCARMNESRQIFSAQHSASSIE